MVDRTKRPKTYPITKVSLPSWETDNLNNIKIFTVQAPKDDQLTKITFVFDAGTWQQKKLLTAYSTIKQISEATKFHTSEQITKILESKAVSVKKSAFYHTSSLTFNFLTKFYQDIIPLIAEIFRFPIFPEKELEIFKQRKKQSLEIDLQKVDVLARNEFYKAIFGKNHPYGVYALPDDFLKISRDDLLDFYQNFLVDNLRQIIIISSDSQKIFNQIQQDFSDLKYSKKLQEKQYEIEPVSEKQIHIPKKDTVQRAIRMGSVSINVNHQDFISLSFVVYLLGGYFGSRLMKKIREQEGLTYGIYSILRNLKYSGVFFIDTEVKKEYSEKVIELIYQEIEKLRNNLVDNQELTRAKNHYFGELLRKYDKPYSLTSYISFLDYYGFRADRLDKKISEIQSLTPEKIQYLAQKYLNPNRIKAVIVG